MVVNSWCCLYLQKIFFKNGSWYGTHALIDRDKNSKCTSGARDWSVVGSSQVQSRQARNRESGRGGAGIKESDFQAYSWSTWVSRASCQGMDLLQHGEHREEKGSADGEGRKLYISPSNFNTCQLAGLSLKVLVI